uniref:UBA domain-containing protein n=2 Tax=Cuerna arida TaxID=1464854 RepID=A0A1B6FTL7_9HEMI
MGFNHSQSVQALKMSNNVVSEAVSIIHDQPHLLASSSRAPSEESIAQVASLGIEPELAREALEKCPELERAVKSLSSMSQSPQASEALAAASASAMSFLENFHKKRKAKMEKEKQAFERVSEGLIDNDLTDDHLDVSLAQEEQFLMEYLSLLN